MLVLQALLANAYLLGEIPFAYLMTKRGRSLEKYRGSIVYALGRSLRESNLLGGALHMHFFILFFFFLCKCFLYLITSHALDLGKCFLAIVCRYDDLRRD